MKTINASCSYCDCNCPLCEYHESIFECPYCGENQLEELNGKDLIIECDECEKKYKALIKYDYI